MNKEPKCIIVLKDMQPFVNISFVELNKVKQLMKLIFWIFKIGSKWNKFNHINALQQHEKLMFGDFAFRFSLHWRTSCKTKVKSIFLISFVMAVLDQEPDVGEILSKINGVIVSGCLYECPSTNNLVTSGKQKTCKIRKSIENY